MAGATRYVRNDTGGSEYDLLEELVRQHNLLVDDLADLCTALNTANGSDIAAAAGLAAKIALIQDRIGAVSGGESSTGQVATQIAVNAGDAQSGTVAAALSTPLSVIVRDATNTVVPGVVVAWSSADDGTLGSGTSITNTSGVASMTYTLGQAAGSKSVTATVSGVGSVTFSATATAAAAASITAASTTDQSGTTSGTVGAPPSVVIRDQYSNPVSGTTVTWAVTGGGGSRSPATSNSGSDGVASLTSWTLGAAAGQNTLTATAAGLTGSPVTFTANGVASAPTQIAVTSGGSQTGITAGSAATATQFTVRDGSNNAVQGVTVSFAVTSGSGSLGVASAVTNASGQASVTYTTHTTVETATITGSFTNASGTVVSASTTIASTFGTKSKLALQTQPSSSGSSGTALAQQPIVLIQDANGNTVTNATDTITAAVQSGNATISGGSTKAAVAGVATFSGLTLVDVDGGSNVLRFSTGALTTVDSTGTTLAPPIPVALQFVTQPSNVTEDTSTLSCGVWVVDASNVVVPGATNAVTVALTTPGGATLSGTLTVNASSGLASFSGLAVDTTGTYTLTATASGLTSATSTSFTVSAASSLHPNEWASSTTVWDKFADPWASTVTGSVPASGGTTGSGTGRSFRYTTGNTGTWVQGTNSGGASYDANAALLPNNPGNILRVRKNNGSGQGTGPEHFNPGTSDAYVLGLGTFSKFYLHCACMVPSGYRTPVGGVQKLFHIHGTCDTQKTLGTSLVVPAFLGGSDSLTASIAFQLRLQNCGTIFAGSDGAINLTGNVNGGGITVTRGTPLEFEVRGQMNTSGNADGTLEVWIKQSGVWVQRMSYTAIDFSSSATTTKRWTEIELNPTYGGTGTTNGDQDVYYDGPYFSLAV